MQCTQFRFKTLVMHNGRWRFCPALLDHQRPVILARFLSSSTGSPSALAWMRSRFQERSQVWLLLCRVSGHGDQKGVAFPVTLQALCSTGRCLRNVHQSVKINFPVLQRHLVGRKFQAGFSPAPFVITLESDSTALRQP